MPGNVKNIDTELNYLQAVRYDLRRVVIGLFLKMYSMLKERLDGFISARTVAQCRQLKRIFLMVEIRSSRERGGRTGPSEATKTQKNKS